MAFIDDAAVPVDQVVDGARAIQALDQGDVHPPGWPAHSAADNADALGGHVKEVLKPRDPSLEEVAAVTPYQGVDAAPGDQVRRDHRLPERGGRAQHAGVVADQLVGGCLLVWGEGALECQSQRIARLAFVMRAGRHAGPGQEVEAFFQAAARQEGEGISGQFAASDDAGHAAGRTRFVKT